MEKKKIITVDMIPIEDMANEDPSCGCTGYGDLLSKETLAILPPNPYGEGAMEFCYFSLNHQEWIFDNEQ